MPASPRQARARTSTGLLGCTTAATLHAFPPSSSPDPALTERWHDRHRRLSAVLPGPEAVLADVITHPEMLAVACLLIASQRPPGIQPGKIAARLGFPCPSRPHPLHPLQHRLPR
jgi:hypothetical protein